MTNQCRATSTTWPRLAREPADSSGRRFPFAADDPERLKQIPCQVGSPSPSLATILQRADKVDPPPPLPQDHVMPKSTERMDLPSPNAAAAKERSLLR